MSVRASAETLKSIPIFAECDPVHLQVLAFSAPRHHFAAGQPVVEQGKSGDAHLILSGSVELHREDGETRAALGVAGAGALLGEIAMISGRAYALTASAETQVETMGLSKDLLLRVAEEYPEFGARVFRALAKRLDVALGDLGDAKMLFDRARSFSHL